MSGRVGLKLQPHLSGSMIWMYRDLGCSCSWRVPWCSTKCILRGQWR